MPKLRSAGPDAISAIKAGPPARSAKGRQAQTEAYGAAVTATEAAIDQASQATQRRIAGGGTGRLGDNSLARKFAGGR